MDFFQKIGQIGTLIDRYSFLMPYRVLKDFKVNFEPYRKWENEGKVDHHHFIFYIFSNESIGSYIHDCEVTDQKLVLSYTVWQQRWITTVFVWEKTNILLEKFQAVIS